MFKHLNHKRCYCSYLRCFFKNCIITCYMKAATVIQLKKELETLNEEKSNIIVETKNINKEKTISLKDILTNYSWSKDYGKPYTFVQEGYDQFLLTTINNVILDGKNIGYLVITENANDVKLAIDERKTFILRTVIFIVIVIFIFYFVLNRYFLKPINSTSLI